MIHRFSGLAMVRFFGLCIGLLLAGAPASAAGSQADSLQNLLDRHPARDSLRFDLLMQLSESLERGAPDRATGYAIEAIEVAEHLGDSLLIARGCQQAGNSYGLLGATQSQRKYYVRAIRISRDIGARKRESDLLNNLATANLQERNYEAAARHLRQSLALAMELNYDKNLGGLYNNLGNLYGQQHVYDSALIYYSKAFEIVEGKTSPFVESVVLGNIGSIYSETRDHARAMQIWAKCIPIKEEAGDIYGLAELYYNIGNSFNKEAEYDSAYHYLQISLALSDSIQAMELQQITNREMYEVQGQMGNLTKALEFAKKTILLLDTLRKEEAVGIAEATEMRFKAEQTARERAFEAQKRDLEQQSAAKRQKIINGGGLLLLALFLTLTVIVYRRYRERQQAARLLEDKVAARTAALSETNERLTTAMREKEASQKDLNTFIYRSSHDLKSPITSIKGLIDITQMTLGEHAAAQYVAMIKDRTEHLDGLLERLVEQVDLLERKPSIASFPVAELWEEVMTSLHVIQGFEAVKFELKAAENLHLRTDREYLKVVLRRLLRNAIDFRKLDQDGNACTVTIETVADGWTLRVRDTGIGMNSEVREKAFDMFYRGSLQAKGSGMGLYSVRKLLDILGARIELSSEENEGAEFVVALPQGD